MFAPATELPELKHCLSHLQTEEIISKLSVCQCSCIYSPDTFRVISQFAEEEHEKHEADDTNRPSEWRRKWLENKGLALPDIYNRKTDVLPHSAPDFRINKPHPGSCGFLRHNVRSLNEPICSVYTDIPSDQQQHWWPSRVSNEPLQIPPRTIDTVYRVDFLEKEQKTVPFGSTRHTSNPNKEPALGTGRHSLIQHLKKKFFYFSFFFSYFFKTAL